MTKPSAPRAAAPARAPWYNFVLGRRCQHFILAVIIINAATLGLQTNPKLVAATGDLLYWADEAALWIFVAEIVLKVMALRFNYVRDPWNLFDFFVVVISFMPALDWMTVLRMLRVLRVLRLISSIPRLRLLVQSLLLSLPSIGWITLLMLVVFYTFAIIGTNLFGSMFPEWFGSLSATFFTLFQVMTLESWSMGIARPVMEHYPQAYMYFVPFVLISAFVMLNAFVAAIINGMDEARSAEKQRQERQERQLQHQRAQQHSQDDGASPQSATSENTSGHTSVNTTEDTHALRLEMAALRAQLDRVEHLLEERASKAQDHA